ncbi:MAG: hypothetical protein ACLPKB_20450 [Xanthobacteraceae bacterium]
MIDGRRDLRTKLTTSRRARSEAGASTRLAQAAVCVCLRVTDFQCTDLRTDVKLLQLADFLKRFEYLDFCTASMPS